MRGLGAWWILGALGAAGLALGCGSESRPTVDSARNGGQTGSPAGGQAGAATGSGGAPLGGGTAGRAASAGAAGQAEIAGGGRGGADAGASGVGAGSAGTNGLGAGRNGAGGAPASGAGGAAQARNGGSAGADVERVALPDGSRERAGVVNLVDAGAATELAGYMAQEPHGLQTSLNLFLKYYVEQYDFVYLISDHDLQTALAGLFISITEPGIVGIGLDYDYEATGYTTNGRIHGVAGINYRPNYFPPFGHEMVHYWANHLNSDFGFGVGLNENDGPHWGYATFAGVLGGLDGDTLRCETPAGAMPPNCTAETSGRFRYRVEPFNPSGYSVHNLAPLELYLMGLLPASELPATFSVLEEGTILSGSSDSSTNTVGVEADGIKTFPASDIIAKHGQVIEQPGDKAALTAAFVVVSATPVSDAILDDIGSMVAVYGGQAADPNMQSIDAVTAGHVSVDTRLGPRRAVSDAPPAMRVPSQCDRLGQDCGGGRGCFFRDYVPTCGLSRGAKRDAACAVDSDCAAGLACVASGTTSMSACEPFCTTTGSGSQSCDSQCATYYTLLTQDNVVVGDVCQPP
jgi:hypothetical protein